MPPASCAAAALQLPVAELGAVCNARRRRDAPALAGALKSTGVLVEFCIPPIVTFVATLVSRICRAATAQRRKRAWGQQHSEWRG